MVILLTFTSRQTAGTDIGTSKKKKRKEKRNPLFSKINDQKDQFLSGFGYMLHETRKQLSHNLFPPSIHTGLLKRASTPKTMPQCAAKQMNNL